MPVRNRFAELLPEITAWRRDFHAHPEILFETHRTAGIVAEKLREFGCDQVIEGVGQTGVVGIINGKTDTSGMVVGLRADMDALPILEATGVEYASTVPGKMHACGHDGHTAMLLGAAKYLCETRNFDGRVALVFQPAEEGGGGAKVMLDDGLLQHIDIKEFYGLHNVPGMPLGRLATRAGPFYGSADQFEIILEGRGGHAAQPHETIDVTVVAAHVITGLQSIVSRNSDPIRSVVVSVTTVETDTTAHNVIAGRVRMTGTARTFTPEDREMVERRIEEITTLTAQAHGSTAKVDYERGYPAVINTEIEAGHLAKAAEAVAGECHLALQYMWGEDFSFFLEERPGAYLHLGIGDNASLHHPEYNFNDEAIPYGCSVFAEIVEQRMPAS